MTVTGLVKINRIKDCSDCIKGVFDFISEKTNSVEQIGFNAKKNDKLFKTLDKFKKDGELLEVTGKLFRNEKNFFINILDIKLGKSKYDLFNHGEDGLGIEL